MMDKRQRIGMQRAMVREALGKLDAATELFGIEDGAVSGSGIDQDEYDLWDQKLKEFKEWVWGESPIA